MSSRFSLKSWALRLWSPRSCIRSYRQPYDRPEGYYALAEDGRGQHCPYPLLPKWAQRAFRIRVALALTIYAYLGASERRVALIDIQCPVRGQNWHFQCPKCSARSFYSYRGSRCNMCGWFFDYELRAIREIYSPLRRPRWAHEPEPDEIPF